MCVGEIFQVIRRVGRTYILEQECIEITYIKQKDIKQEEQMPESEQEYIGMRYIDKRINRKERYQNKNT